MGYPSLKPFRHRCQYCWCFPQLQSFQFLCKCIPKTNMSLGMPVTLPSLISTGPVCISYSMMGNRGCDKDPCMKTHRKQHKEFKKLCQLLCIENVCEYSVPLVKSELGPQWTVMFTRLDSRLFGVPVARARLYLLAFRNDVLQWASDLTLDDFVAMMSSECVMSARNLFWMSAPEKELTNAEVPWLHARVIHWIQVFHSQFLKQCRVITSTWMSHCVSGEKFGGVSTVEGFLFPRFVAVRQEQPGPW